LNEAEFFPDKHSRCPVIDNILGSGGGRGLSQGGKT